MVKHWNLAPKLMRSIRSKAILVTVLFIQKRSVRKYRSFYFYKKTLGKRICV